MFGFWESHERGGRVLLRNDSTTWRVERWHEEVRVKRRRFDCRVTSLQPADMGGVRHGKLTMWSASGVPVDVLQICEGTDPRSGIPTRTEKRLLDYHVRRE
jgi:hypothetical protein